MAVASDLPPIDPLEKPVTPSTILDSRGKTIGTLTGNERRIYLPEKDIAPVMKHAIIAIEDRRFYTNSGVDLRGIARAAVQDVTAGEAVQGASTIPQQFVKISLAAENDRTVFQKLREAALAYHLTRRWTKDQILRNYLNQIYFGNGAYGIESAARTYFSYNHDGCGGRDGTKQQPPCAKVLLPARGRAAGRDGRLAERLRPGHAPGRLQEAARPRAAAHVRAGLHHARALRERQGRAAADARRPDLPEGGHGVPVLHLLDQAAGRRPARRRPAGRAAGLRGRAAGQDDDRLAPAGRGGEGDRRTGCRNRDGPRASLVAISNEDGMVRAMYGGDDYARRAVQPRHPGPAPARLVVQAVRARRGAQAGHQPELDLGVEEAHLHPQGR